MYFVSDHGISGIMLQLFGLPNNWTSPTESLIDSHVKSVLFFKTEPSTQSLWVPGGLARAHMRHT